MKRVQVPNRYLAGLVIAMAVVYFGLVYMATARPWPDRDPPSLLNLMLLGVFPALATILFGICGWRAMGGRSPAMSAAGLLVLLVGLILLRGRGVLT